MNFPFGISRTDGGSLDRIRQGLDSWLVKDKDTGRIMIDREIFTDPEVFELEMKYIFERNWIYLAHESQIAKPNDFLTTHIGRQPVLLMRSRDGEIQCFINACSHRGARLCRAKSGNRKTHTCPFHGWTYSSNGDLLDVTDEANGGYPEGFDRSTLGLQPVARVESYRGFIFASLCADVQSLPDYLAGSKAFIDLFVDQSPTGDLEILRGTTRYTYPGNWKLQAENGLDGYHIGSVHANYFMTVMRRLTGESTNDTKAFDFSKWSQTKGGFISFDHGHQVLWATYANFKDRPNFALRDWYEKEYGPIKAEWMNGRLRNMLLYPNVFLMDQTSTQMRIIRPIAVDQTEITTYCIAPVGESAQARAVRIRQYEDFFNASGMATPDDLTEFENSQIGFGHGPGRHNDLSRGATRWVRGDNGIGEGLELDAVMTSSDIADEGLYLAIQEDWLERMKAAVETEQREQLELEAAQ